jgi:hypothetical protein
MDDAIVAGEFGNGLGGKGGHVCEFARVEAFSRHVVARWDCLKRNVNTINIEGARCEGGRTPLAVRRDGKEL